MHPHTIKSQIHWKQTWPISYKCTSYVSACPCRRSYHIWQNRRSQLIKLPAATWSTDTVAFVRHLHWRPWNAARMSSQSRSVTAPSSKRLPKRCMDALFDEPATTSTTWAGRTFCTNGAWKHATETGMTHRCHACGTKWWLLCVFITHKLQTVSTNCMSKR